MSELLRLYPEVLEPSPIEAARAAEVDPNCVRCPLHKAAKHVCMPADGEPWGVLIVGDHPGRAEDANNHVFHGESGSYLRRQVRKLYTGPVAYDNAVRCYNGGGTAKLDIDDEHVEACRGYLAGTLFEVKPRRVIAVGGMAVYSLLGRSFTPVATRRAYGWLTQQPDGRVPVFMLPNPVMALSNSFIRTMFEQDLDWALNCPVPKEPPWEGLAHVITSPEDAQVMAAEMRLAEWFSFDVETSGKQYNRDFRLLSMSFCAKDADHGWVFHVEQLDNPATRETVFALMRDGKAKKGGQNVKYDNNTLRALYGVSTKGIVFDTRLGRRVLEPEAPADLDSLGDLVGLGGHKDEARKALAVIKDRLRAQNGRVAKAKRLRAADRASGQKWLLPEDLAAQAEVRLGKKVDPDSDAYGYLERPVLLRYNTRDSLVTSTVEVQIDRQLKAEPDLYRTFHKVVMPAAHAVEMMEYWGIGVSRNNIEIFQNHVKENLVRVEERLSHYGRFNPSSTVQVRTLLFDKLGLSPVEYTKTGVPSTDEACLEQLKTQHEVVGDLLEHRKLTKMFTYAAGKDGETGLMEWIRDDGRIHPTIHLDGARTGRASVTDPGLHQIPSDKKNAQLGKLARDCFAAPPGHVIISLDYSQIELRVAALLSGDPVMRQIFIDGKDYHQMTAQLISMLVWSIAPEAVSAEHRRAAKAFNFGILFGMSDEGIAARAGCSVEEATKIRAAIFGKMKKLEEYTRACLAETTATGYAWTWWDNHRARRRPMYRIVEQGRDDRTRESVSKAKHGSWNTPIQGTANEFCSMAAVAVVDLIESDGLPAKLMLPIHDALLLEVPERHAVEVALTCRDVMTSFNSGDVPLVVDVEMGPTWGSLEKFRES